MELLLNANKTVTVFSDWNVRNVINESHKLELTRSHLLLVFLSNQAVKMLESREKATPGMFGELLRNASMGDLRSCPVRHFHN